MTIGLKDYKALIALSEERHFGRAARRLKVSQPALTSRLYRVEAELGVALFVRSRRGVEETIEGRVLCEQARRIVDAHEEALLRVREARHGFGMALRVGTTQLAVHQVLIASLRAFRQSYPEARVILSEGTSFALERDLEKGVLDVVFLHPPLHAPGLSQRVLRKCRIVLADCSGNWSPGDSVVRYPRSEAPVMMGSLEREIPGSEGTPVASYGEAHTAITSLALSAAGYGAAFVTEELPDFGFDLADVSKSEPLSELETSVAFRQLDRRPIVKAFLGCVPDPRLD